MGEIMGESDNGGAWCQPRQGAFKALGRPSGGQRLRRPVPLQVSKRVSKTPLNAKLQAKEECLA